MLLRASMIYGLAVVCLLVVFLALWQRMEIGANRETYLALTGRIERLQNDLDGARVDLAAAERRAAVAEDALTRARTAFGTSLPGDAAEERLTLDLAEATRERDAARNEALALAHDLGQADKKLIEARQRLESLEKQLSAQAAGAKDASVATTAGAEPGAATTPAVTASDETPAHVPANIEPAINTKEPANIETGSLERAAPDAGADADADRLLEVAVPADAGREPVTAPAGDMTSRTAATSPTATEGQVAPSVAGGDPTAAAPADQPLPEVIPETAPAVAPRGNERSQERTATRDLDAETQDILQDEPASAEPPVAAPPQPAPKKAAKAKKKRTARKKPSSSSDPFSIFPF